MKWTIDLIATPKDTWEGSCPKLSDANTTKIATFEYNNNSVRIWIKLGLN